jgi:tetratricopeptide (TPR) repeat protein
MGVASNVRIVESGGNDSFLSRFRRSKPEIKYQEDILEVPDELADPAQLSLAYAKLMEESGNVVEAETHYTKVLAEQPEHVAAIVGLSRVQQRTGRPEAAEQGLHKALRLDPHSPVALHALGQIYAAQGRWDEGAELLNKAVLAAPNEKAYRYDLAVALVHADNIEAALPHFIRTVGDAEAHYNVGLILHQQGRLVESEEQLRLALSRKPDLQQAQYWLDVVRRQQGDGALSQSLPGVAAGHAMPLALAATP